MRLPLISELDSRDGESNKDSRLTNTLVESEEGGPIAQVRPGLETLATGTGNGNGLVCLDKSLVSVFGTTLADTAGLSAISTVVTGDYDFAQSPT